MGDMSVLSVHNNAELCFFLNKIMDAMLELFLLIVVVIVATFDVQ